MSWQFSPLSLPGFAYFFVAWCLAAMIFAARPFAFQNRVLALAISLEGTGSLFFALITGMRDPGDAYAARITIHALYGVLFIVYLMFLGTLQGPLARPFSGTRTRIALAFIGVISAAFVILSPRALHPGVVPVPLWEGWDASQSQFFSLWLAAGMAVYLYGVGVAVSMYMRSSPGSAARVQAAFYAGAFGTRDLLFAASWLLVIVSPGTFLPAGTLVLVVVLQVSGITAFTLLLAYGFLRHQLLDIDVKIKWTINKGMLAGIFVGVFFVSAQVAQAFLTTEYGWAIGGVVAGILLLAINPLQRFASNVADRTMPNVQDTHEYRTVRKREVYQAALEEILLDGQISAKERRTLIRLQEQLGLDASTAQTIEVGVLDRTGGA